MRETESWCLMENVLKCRFSLVSYLYTSDDLRQRLACTTLQVTVEALRDRATLMGKLRHGRTFDNTCVYGKPMAGFPYVMIVRMHQGSKHSPNRRGI